MWPWPAGPVTTTTSTRTSSPRPSPRPRRRMEDFDPEIRDDIAADALERSELIGFWVAWHLAGGFDNLERGGWHRATIFRKVRRFRAAYGAHPDEFVFPWMQLDLETAWSEQIAGRSRQPAVAASSAEPAPCAHPCPRLTT